MKNNLSHFLKFWARASYLPIRTWRIFTLIGEFMLLRIRQMANCFFYATDSVTKMLLNVIYIEVKVLCIWYHWKAL